MQSRPCASSSLFFFFPPLLLYSLEVQALFTKTNSLAFRIPGGVEAPRGVYEGGTIPLARLGEAATQPYIRVRIRRFVRVELDVGSQACDAASRQRTGRTAPSDVAVRSSICPVYGR